MSDNNTHHRLGPSAAHRWMNCPGSVAAEAALEDAGSSVYAAEGSAAHFAAAEILQGTAPSKLLGTVYTDGPHEIEITQEMLDYVEGYVERIHELPRGFSMVEHAVRLEPWIPGGYGTADHIHVSADTVIVTDLKYGRGLRVDADENPQLQLYGLGAIEEVGYLYDLRRVVLRIDQPRLDHVSEWETTVDALLGWGEQVKAAARTALSPDAPRVPGEKQCKWCAAKARCPAVRDLVENSMADFPVLEGRMADTDLAAALAVAGLASDWAHAVQALALEQLGAGHTVEGWKLVAGRTRRDWADEAAAEKRLRRLLKVDVAAPRKLISPAQAQKALGRERWDKVANLVAVKPGKPSLAPSSDPRPAIDPAAACGFDNLPE